MYRCRMGNPKKSSRFICLSHVGINEIGNGIQRSNQRQKGHVKDLYCLQCKAVTKNLEVIYCDSFDEMMQKAEKLHREYLVEEHNNNAVIIEQIVTSRPKKAYVRCFGELLPITIEEASTITTTVIWL